MLKANQFPLPHRIAEFQKKFSNSFLLKFYLFSKLPAAWFMGIRLKTIALNKAEVLLPYHWRSQNPFRSTYFAAQCAAGEFSTGILASLILAGFEQKISMLVTHVEAEFYKKATDITTFTCSDGQKLFDTVKDAVNTKEARAFRAESIGTNQQGEIVSKVWITWSFKAKG
jgi:hypothetical protein